MSTIADRLAQVNARIDAAVARAGRRRDQVRLLAVSKTKPIADIEAAYAAGQRWFGENYAQELDEKRRALAHLPDIEWHFVGALQTNKAKLVAPHATVVHAVDSIRLGRELSKRASSRTHPLDLLVEINVGGEASKAGVRKEDAASLIDALEKLPNVRVRGLMSIPPPLPDVRPFHAALRSLRDDLGGATRLPELSMGMTDDLEVAIEEGATIVRIGTAIFGSRK